MSTVLWPNGKTTPPNFSWEGHFGWRNANLSYASSFHRGQDFYGLGEVHSIADGIVRVVGRVGGWAGGGYMVWIQHDGFFSRSLHLQENSARVVTGQRVVAGQVIGIEGATNAGGYGMARHLHLEITPGELHFGNSGQIDPRAWLKARVGKSGGTTGGGGGSANDYDDLENDMSAKDDLEFLVKQVGGSRSRKTSLREDVDKLHRQVGGSDSRKTSLRQDVDELQRAVKEIRQVLGSTVARAKKGDTLGVRLDKIIKHLSGKKPL